MRFPKFYPYAFPVLLSVLWCVLVLALFQRSINSEQMHADDLALLQVRTLCAQMLDTRTWNATHGGIFVKESVYGVANPWLPEEIRRVTLDDGTSLVLINPAYMSRQVADFSSARGTHLRIVGQVPLNPQNKADAWEAVALDKITGDKNEIFGQEHIKDIPVFRYIAPLRIDDSCLQCHTGSKIGELQGGISVVLEAEPFMNASQQHKRSLAYSYGFMGIAGILGIGSLSSAIARKRVMAEQKAKIQSAFLANMSHDMRTPLSGIIGMSELLEGNTSLEKNKEACWYLRSAANALLEMITDITTHAALEAEQITLNKEPFVLVPALEQCLDLFRPACAEKGLALDLIVHKPLPEVVMGDSFRLRQAIGNLVGNSVKFTQQGKVELRIRCEWLDEQQVRLAIDIADTGPGIQAEDHQRIFERFSQGDSGRYHRSPGTGLGLSISRDIAMLMQGDLTLQSTPGHGSVFTLRVCCDVAKPGDGQPVALFCKTVPVEKIQPLHILLAEDTKVNAFFMREILEKEGHTVYLAQTGDAALELLGTRNIDVAILDMHMPGVSGLEILRCIRSGQCRTNPLLPVICITAARNKDIQEALLQSGAQMYLEKPLQAKVILDALHTVSYLVQDKIDARLFDQNAALEAMDGDQRLLRKLVQTMLEELPMQKRQLEQALESQDKEKIYCLSHALKNSSAMLCLHALCSMCADLESAVKDDSNLFWDNALVMDTEQALRLYLQKGDKA